MKAFKTFLIVLIVFGILGGTGFFFFNYYSWIFSKTITGKIVDVQRVTNPGTIINATSLTPAQIHSYSVLVQGHDNHLYTASSEDRQWQVAGKGYCVKAKLFRYPPWNLEKAGTYFNARIEELSLCGNKIEPNSATKEMEKANEVNPGIGTSIDPSPSQSPTPGSSGSSHTQIENSVEKNISPSEKESPK